MNDNGRGLAVDEDALGWLAAMLGPDADGGNRRRGSRDERWAVLPSARRPRMLVPLGAPRAASAVLRRRDTGFATRNRRILSLAFRYGITPAGLGSRLAVPEGHSFTRWMAGLLDERELCAGVTIGPPRPNRKAVVQMVRPDGATVAWVKVSCTPLTAALVTNEGDWLHRINRSPVTTADGRSLEVPVPLARARWRDLDVLVTTPLPGRTSTGGFAPDADLLRAVARLDDGGVHRAAHSPWWSAVRDRIGTVPGMADRDLLQAAVEAMGKRLAAVTWSFGAWHGDLTSWNARSCGHFVQIWDWERCGAPLPVGFDAAHAAFQAAQIARHLGVPAAASAADEAVAVVLADIGDDPAAATDLVTSYLIERWLRWDEDTRLGSGTSSGARHGAILAAIGARQRGVPVS